MSTVRQCFEIDYSHCLIIYKTIQAKHKDNGTEHHEARLYLDFAANCKFASIYLSTVEHVNEVLPAIANDLEPLLLPSGRAILPMGMTTIGAQIRVANNGAVLSSRYTEPDSPITVSDEKLVFTGRLFVYTPFDIPHAVQVQIASKAKERNNISLVFRGPLFASAMSATPSAFISHDSRDKDSIARPIATQLRQFGHNIWYDEFSLEPGDSLRESIEAGLKECRKCIVILTPNFLSKGGWAKREYDSIYTRELIEEKRVIIPIWFDVSPKDVFEYSPILADRFGLDWSVGQEQVCNKLNELLIFKGAGT